MKIITEPTIHILSEPLYHPHPNYDLPEHDNASENIIATAGKICYDSFGKDGRSVDEHVMRLVSERHYSVLEHANISLFIEGISRGLSHELVRHRHFSYSQRSTRYTAEEDSAIVLDPFFAALYKDVHNISDMESDILSDFIESAQKSVSSYDRNVKRLLEYNSKAIIGFSKTEKRKWARGKARQLLPHALETRLVMTGNLTAWREMLVKRTNRHAEAEIRRLAHMIYEKLYEISPRSFEIPANLVDNYIELTNE